MATIFCLRLTQSVKKVCSVWVYPQASPVESNSSDYTTLCILVVAEALETTLSLRDIFGGEKLVEKSILSRSKNSIEIEKKNQQYLSLYE